MKFLFPRFIAVEMTLGTWKEICHLNFFDKKCMALNYVSGTTFLSMTRMLEELKKLL